jgi:hypothetical protein
MKVLLIQKDWNVIALNAVKKEFKKDPTFELEVFNPTHNPKEDILDIGKFIRDNDGDVILVEDCLEGYYYGNYFHSIWDQPVLYMYNGSFDELPVEFEDITDKAHRFSKIGNERSIVTSIGTSEDKTYIIPMIKDALRNLRSNYMEYKSNE